ncbi:hypothetical protein JCM5350_005774 [Sporobolomyces pararoseus]
MSLLRRALRSVGLRVGKDRYLVGTDLEGNSFYEKPHPEYPDEWRKNKRYVEYRVTRYLSDYNYHTIPVQWSSWLRRTRKQPPTLPELETDYYRQLKLKENVSKLEQLYKEEKLRLSQSDQQALSSLPEAEAAREDGLPRDDVGIGKKEMEIGTNLGINNTSTSEEKQQEDHSSSSSSSKDKSSEELAKERREFDREQARKRREEFARSQPPTGNPSDSFQPQAWNPSSASSPRPINRR